MFARGPSTVIRGGVPRHASSRLRRQPSHPQANREGIRLGQDRRRAAQGPASRSAIGRLAVHPRDGRIQPGSLAEAAWRGGVMPETASTTSIEGKARCTQRAVAASGANPPEKRFAPAHQPGFSAAYQVTSQQIKGPATKDAKRACPCRRQEIERALSSLESRPARLSTQRSTHIPSCARARRAGSSHYSQPTAPVLRFDGGAHDLCRDAGPAYRPILAHRAITDRPPQTPAAAFHFVPRGW